MIRWIQEDPAYWTAYVDFMPVDRLPDSAHGYQVGYIEYWEGAHYNIHIPIFLYKWMHPSELVDYATLDEAKTEFERIVPPMIILYRMGVAVHKAPRYEKT